MCTPTAPRHPRHFLEVVAIFVIVTCPVLATPEVANAEAYLCAVDRFCDDTDGCKVWTGSEDWFDIEADGSASVFAGHKSTRYHKVSETDSSRTFFSDDGGSFPSMRTLYADGKFTESVHVARPESARPEEAGPIMLLGTCKRTDG